MKKLNLKKGFEHPLTEKIVPRFEMGLAPESIALVPYVIKGIKAKLLVKENDHVKTGTPVFTDKNNPEIVFLSPGCGTISNIEVGKKRAIKKIEIKLDENEDFQELESITESTLREISDEELKEALLKSGMWPFIKSLPYQTIADHNKKPSKIFVKLSDNAPYYPLPETWLKHRYKAFDHGLNILKRLADDVVVYADDANHFIKNECQDSINYLVSGNYPAFHPGTLAYRLKSKPEDSNAWYIDGQNLVILGETLLNGKLCTEKTFIVGGPQIGSAYHIKSRAGASVKSLLKEDLNFDVKQRFISGDVYTGFRVDQEGYTGFYESSLTVLPEGDEKEFFGFMKLGTEKQSFSKTFLSKLLKTKPKTDCNTNGELRACINCGYCESVCPVDILPQFTMKALYADDIETALAHGLMDCVSCSLCTYVCPSKISLSEILTKAKDNFLKEEKAD